MSYLWNGIQFLLNNNIKVIKTQNDRVRKRSSFMHNVFSNRFIADEISDFISNNWNGLTYISHKYIINDQLKIEWNVVDVMGNNESYELDERMLKIIYGLYKNSVCFKKDSCELVRIGFWNTPFIKYLPFDSDIELDYFHINSGCTYNYSHKNIGDVYIWREQEWIKTLFHEITHAFKYDNDIEHFGFCCSNSNLGNEAYVEWIGILMTLLYLSKNEKQFIKKYNNFLKHNKKNMDIIIPYYNKRKQDGRMKVNLFGYWILNSYFWKMPKKLTNQIIKDKLHINKSTEQNIAKYLHNKVNKII